MSERLLLPAPGKLNLFLHVTGRREDGYHLLQTLFQLVDYCDELAFEARDDGKIELMTGAPGVDSNENLVVRAARLLKERSGSSRGVSIALDKRLPIGGGMGGGSSDAATTLVALDELWDLRLARAEMEALALELGADVPIFVRGRSAWAEGIGEELTPVELPPRWYLVIVPKNGVATAEVFASADLTRNSAPIKIADFLRGGARNDCEPVVRRLSTEVDRAINWLSQWGPARMTGTGSCVFLPCADRAEADEIYARLPGQWRGFVARGINESPLYRDRDLP